MKDYKLYKIYTNLIFSPETPQTLGKKRENKRRRKAIFPEAKGQQETQKQMKFHIDVIKKLISQRVDKKQPNKIPEH